MSQIRKRPPKLGYVRESLVPRAEELPGSLPLMIICSHCGQSVEVEENLTPHASPLMYMMHYLQDAKPVRRRYRDVTWWEKPLCPNTLRRIQITMGND